MRAAPSFSDAVVPRRSRDFSVMENAVTNLAGHFR